MKKRMKAWIRLRIDRRLGIENLASAYARRCMPMHAAKAEELYNQGFRAEEVRNAEIKRIQSAYTSV